jgi:hypothetical protein
LINIEQDRDTAVQIDDFSIMLTEYWFCIPINEKENRTEVVDEYFEKLFIKFKNEKVQPPLKKELKKTLTEQINQAEKVGAVFMAFFSLIIEDVPIDASLTIYGIGAQLPIEDIYNSYKEKKQAATLIKGEKHSIIRRDNIDEISVSGETEIKQARVEYWLNASPADTGYYFVFTSTYLDIIEALIEMFDMIALSALEEFQG